LTQPRSLSLNLTSRRPRTPDQLPLARTLSGSW
jgi:hypothetical protein